MKNSFLLFLCIIGICNANEHRETWRIDYFYTGGLETSVYSLDEVVVEPLPWPDSKKGDIGTLGFGVFRFEVQDTTGKVLYTRGFSPIFWEWESTSEAKKRNRTFEESLRFPAPAGKANVVVKKRQSGDEFKEVWRLELDPSDMYINRAIPPIQELITLEDNGNPTEKLDIVMLGDGYTVQEMDKFKADAIRMMEALFAEEPFKRRRKDFNIWGICPPSPESGVSRPSTGIHINSPIGSSYDIFGSERYLLTYENKTMREVASYAPNDFVLILANTKTYGGGGIYNQQGTVAVDNAWAEYVFVHEFGHSFAALADEYYTSPVAYSAPGKVEEPWEANATALLDPEDLKWKSFIEKDTPLPTPWPKAKYETHSRKIQERRKDIRAKNLPESEMSALFNEQMAFETQLFTEAPYYGKVGAYQGGNYDAQAFYRPEIDCIMFSRNDVPFCRVCTSVIEDVIDLYTGK